MLTRYRYQSIRNGLVGHWRPSRGATGNTLIDSVRGNHGTLVNGPTWQAGGSGLALNFDGTNDYVGISNVIRSLSNRVSISTWFFNRGNFTAYQTLFDCGNAGSSRQLSCFLGGTSSQLYVAIRSPAGGAPISLSTTMTLNAWTHLALAYDGTTTTAFINGISSGSSTAVSGVTYTDFEFQIGGNPSGGGAAFNGLQDDTAIWNRTLNAPEILALYTAGRGALDQRVNVLVVRGHTSGGIPQSINVGIVSETESTQSISVLNPKSYMVSTTQETETVNAVTISNSRSYTVGIVSENESVTSLSILNPKSYSVVIVTETESVVSVTTGSSQQITVGIVTETESLNSVTILNPRSYNVSVVNETESVSSITIVNPRSYSISAATETESVLSVSTGTSQQISVLLATETESALTCSIVNSRSYIVNQVTELESSLICSVLNPKSYAVNLAVEVESVLAVSLPTDTLFPYFYYET